MKKHIIFLFTLISMIGTNVWALEQKDGVYQIGTVEDLVAFAELVNGGEHNANAVLTANIDMGGADWTPIAAGACYYAAVGPADVTSGGFAGFFNGQGYTISNLIIKPSGEASGFFGVVTGSVKNLGLVNATFDSSSTYRAGAIVGTITATDYSVGRVENCYVVNSKISNIGNVCGAVAGAVYGGTLINCYAANNEVVGYGDRIGGIAGDTKNDRGWAGTVINCHTDHNRLTSVVSGITENSQAGVTAERFQSGEIAYKLNGSTVTLESVWRQNLGEDNYPVLSAESKIVYAQASEGFRCDGMPMGEIIYTNNEVNVDVPQHEHENGFCKYCGVIDPNFLTPENGVYALGTAQELTWFAEKVNSGDGKINAILTADIDMGGIDWTSIGVGSCYAFASGPATIVTTGFAGVFDGQGHIVSNFKINDSSEAAGFFGLLTGTVKNLGIANATFNSTKSPRVGGITGTVTATAENVGLVENCYVADSKILATECVCGAVAGAVYGGMVQNCYAVNNELSGYRDRFGGIAGDTRSEVGWQGTVKNCYTDVARVTSPQSGITTGCEGSVSAERFQSGEITYKLNGSANTNESVWRQNLGEDNYPVLSAESKMVYAQASEGFRCDGLPMGEVTYTNNEVSVDVPLHENENGFCNYCGRIDPDFVIPVNGVYPLGTAEELVWFAAKVNNGESKINAVLTADIDMGGMEWNPIAPGSCYYAAAGPANVTNAGFAGVFDGKGFTISNFTIKELGESAGLFGIVTGTVKNLGIVNATFNSTVTYRSGAIAGTVTATVENVGRVENCYVIDSKILTNGSVCGAVAGAVYGGVVQNCYAVNNELSGYADRFGGISGDSRNDAGWSGTVNNCYTDFVRVTSSQAGVTIGGEGSIQAERFQSGEVAYRLNGSTTSLASVWRQNIGEDTYPVVDSTHSYVVPLGETFLSVMEDNFENVRDEIYEKETEYNESVICARTLNATYGDALNAFVELSTIEVFFSGYESLLALKSQLETSAAGYAVYQAKIDYINTYLTENTVEGNERDILDVYLNETVEPGDTYPNGSYPYIIENRLLDNEEVAKETDYAQLLLDMAISGGYLPGTDITNLMVNADFSNGTEGWTVENGTLAISNLPEAGMPYVGYTNGTPCITKTLTEMKPGIYLVTVNAAYRAAGDNASLNQTAFIFANNNKVYVPTLREGIIPADTESANTGLYTPVEGEEGQIIGYQPTSTEAIAHAFGEGYYKNSIVAEVGEDGILTLGIQTLGCQKANDTWVGAFKLMYCGTADSEESKEASTQVQNDQLARLNTVANDYEFDYSDYQAAPNYSESLRTEAMTAVENGPVDTDQLAKITELGNLMQNIYDCKQAYADMVIKAEILIDFYSGFAETGIITEEEGNEIMDAYNVISDAYVSGTFSLEKALATDPIKGVSFAPSFVADVAQVGNGKELVLISTMVNSGLYRDMDIVLLNDIDMTGIPCPPIGYTNFNELYYLGQPITNPGYAGIFDGKGHIIKNFRAIYNPEYAANGVFGTITGTVKNLGIVNYHFDVAEVPVYYSGRFGALCGQLVEGTILNCYVTGSTVIISTEIASSIAAGNYGGTIQNCYEYGNNIQPYPRSGKLVGDARDENGVRIGTEINCYSEGKVTGNYESNVVGCESFVSKERFQGGEIAFLLNGGATSADEVVWYQSILEDESPVLDNTHYIVRQTDGGQYTNFDDVNTELLALIQEAQALSDSTRNSGYQPLILRGDQLSENCFWQAGYEIQNIIDGNFGSFFHSRTDIPLDEGTEYFQVNLDAPISGFYLEYTGRSDGIASGWAWHDTPDEIRIEATNTPDDESSWKQISIEKYDIPNYHGAYYKSEVPIKLGAPYQYIRFYVLHATTGQNYWNIAEFQMYDAATTLSPEMLQTLDIMDAAALEKLALVKAGAGTQTDIDELQALIDLIKNQTGIEQIVDNSHNNNAIYTLDGRLVNSNVSAGTVKSLSKGLYIINGRKVLIK